MAENKARIAAIDHFRGLTILFMVLVNFLDGAVHVWPMLKHSPDVGLTLTDLVAPFFYFAIGLTYGPSVRRRIAKVGRDAAMQHLFERYAAILGLGYLISAVGHVVGIPQGGQYWGVLQAIGMAGLVAIPFILLPAWVRALSGLILLLAYHFLLYDGWLSIVKAASHGGIQGATAWSAMLLLATALGDLYADERNRRWLPWAGLLLVAAGVALAPLSPVSKARVSPTYVLVSTGLGALVFWGFHRAERLLAKGPRLLAAWGRNPLFLYLLQFGMLGPFYVLLGDALYAQAPGWLLALEDGAVLAVLSAVALALDRRGWTWSL